MKIDFYFLKKQKKLNLYLKDVEVEIQLFIRASSPKAAWTSRQPPPPHERFGGEISKSRRVFLAA